jgi:membrane fusion protein, copper/silver efflux system
MERFTLSVLVSIATTLFGGCGQPEQKVDTTDKPPTQVETQKKSNEVILTRQQVNSVTIMTEKAEAKSVPAPLTLSGKVAVNERLTALVTARVTGRVERVHRVAGDHAKRGEPVVELYSQEFLTMQSEFIQAEERVKRMNRNQSDYGTAQAIYQSARKKLQILGMADSEIETLADGHNPLTLLSVRAPFDGSLLVGEAHLGTFVQVGAEFFTISDLRIPWVVADVFERDIPLVSEGLPCEVIVTPYPAEMFKGKLRTILDMVDEKSRTVKVRFDVENRNDKLKPGMFATIILNVIFGGKNIKVPSSAVLENKGQRYVFVAINDTTFVQRPVKIGGETKTYTEVLDGLRPGELVVSKGAFFLKSEMGKSVFMEEE